MAAIEDHYTFIEKVLARTGWSQTDLAARSGIDPSTLSRFLSKGRSDHTLRASTINRIAKASGLAFGDDPILQSFHENEAEPYEFKSNDQRAAAISALIGEKANVNAWTLNSRALENVGYRPGDALLVGLGETPLAGDIVCAQIYDWAKSQAQTVFRIYQPPALVGASNDPNLLTPYLLSDSAVVVKGVVLHTLRSR